MVGVEVFISDFQAASLSPEGPFKCGASHEHDFVIFRKLEVLSGDFAGRYVDLAVLVPKDYPLTPPSGFYLDPQLLPHGVRNVHLRTEEVSGLPEGSWLYWSRPLNERWRREHPSQDLLAHWQTAIAQETAPHA